MRRFNALYKTISARRAGARPPGLQATWVSVALSFEAMSLLTDQAALFEAHEAFRDGMRLRSPRLGDPQDEGGPKNWVIGRDPANTAHVLLTIAADRASDLASELKHWFIVAREHRLVSVFEEHGRAREGGKESFGFRDNISQPGLRGRAADRPAEWLTPPSPTTTDYGARNEPRVYPGEFILGYRRQSPHFISEAAEGFREAHPLLRDGSFLVFRRLRQNKDAFWNFVQGALPCVRAQPGWSAVDREGLASQLVGRWPDGAPLSRAPATGPDSTLPAAQRSALGEDPLANNQFGYAASRLGRLPASGYPEAPADPLGERCPVAAHVRKVNPRDESHHLGAGAESRRRLILRRGIPFNRTAGEGAPEEGLLFLCYQASIEEQFEFLTHTWMNQDSRPRGGGFDLLVGQNTRIQLTGTPAPKRQLELRDDAGRVFVIDAPAENPWVVPTGGGYFFAPSLPALEALARPR